MPDNKLYTLREFLEKGIYDPKTSTFSPVGNVVVPKIQRPYAQGRRSPVETEIRKKFIGKIFQALVRKNEKMELNFVYGSLNDSRFELLDGQQRLTTLFLLSWYLAMRADDPAGNTLHLNKFSYQTRTTSKLFIKKLLKKPIAISDYPSAIIRELPWYTSAFSKDSTVTGMLTMLDEIHDCYMETPEAECPGIEALDSLRFYLLELTNFGLTDDLFVKMNARGLQLTPFENFKAELVGWIRSKPYDDDSFETPVDKDGVEAKAEDKKGDLIPYWLYFSSHVDGRWIDLFWEMPEGDPDPDNLGATESDRRFFTFIKRWLANRALAITENAQQDSETEFFHYFNDKATDNNYYSFEMMRRFLEFAHTKRVNPIKDLGKTLRFFSDKELGDMLWKSFVAPWEKRSAMPWDEKMGMREMIIFSAITEFILMQPDDPEKFDRKEFQRWMRLVHNIVQNRDVNRELLQIVLTRQLKRALGFNGKPIYARFSDYVSSLGGQSNREFNSEKEKIERINENAEWDPAFIEAERDPFMTGSVTFYLDEATTIGVYKARTKRVPLLFDSNGVTPVLSDNYKLIRAIMVRSYDYSSFRIPAGNLFLTNRNKADRFLKNMTVWNSDEECRRLFRQLLDCESIEDICKKLDEVVTEKHEVSVPDSFKGDRQLLQTGYETLCALNPNPLGWLEGTKENSMKVYFESDGRMTLYKGPVNCLYLNVDNEKFIPSFQQALESRGFSIKYVDNRSYVSYENYGLYSGSSVVIRISGHDKSFLAWCGVNFRMRIYHEEAEVAEALSREAGERYSRELSLDETGELHTWAYDGVHLYCGLTVPDIRQASPDYLAELLLQA